mmetsp:Transcript_22292/g.53383  ORF Transcript_22292/g.53383 Transcript_22292/m.53383 type:complete len:281 (-) Transcript_22292:263-1105(-)
MSAPLEVGQAELHLAVEPPRPQQRGVERVGPVGRHQDLDVAARVEAVELVDNLEHRALHLVVAARAVVEARAADGVHLVDEDDARLLRARHLEELTHHARPLAHVLLHELAADDTDEARVRSVGHGARGERLAGAWRAIQQDALRGVNAELHEALGVQHRQLQHLAQLLDLVLVAADVVVRDVGLLLDSHHRHCRVDLRREGDLDLVLVAIDADAHALLHIRRGDPVAEPDHELCNLLHVDHVLCLVRVRADDLGAARDLQRLLLLHHLLVGHEVPLCGR